MSSAPEVELQLLFELGGRSHRYCFASGAQVLGRKSSCSVVVDDPSVSRQHAMLALEDGRWLIRDLQSANGLRVDGALVERHEVLDGDRVLLGDVELELRLPSRLEVALADDGEGDSGEDTGGALSSAIDVGDFDGLLTSVLHGGAAALTAVPTGEAPGESTVLGARGPAGAVWIVRMLRDAADALLGHDDLEGTLQRVLDLVFEHLPADRGAILCLDGPTGELVPKAQRATGADPDGNLRISRQIADMALRSKQAVLVQDARGDRRFSAAASIVSLNIRSAMCAPLCHKGVAGGLIYVDRTAPREVFTRTHLEVLSILASLSAAAVERAQLNARIAREQQIRARLSRYNAPAVIDRIITAAELGEGEASGMAAEEREVSVLFADIAGFTTLSENLPPREVTALLNEVFQMLTEEVFGAAGTLDKFIGDAMMVFFGAPLPQSDHAERAVRVALGMQRRMASFNAARPDRAPVAIRIGVQSGPAIVGDVGHHERRDYTVIGDVVNTASRLRSAVADRGQVVIGAATRELLGNGFACEALAAVQLRGKAQWIEPFLVTGEAAS